MRALISDRGQPVSTLTRAVGARRDLSLKGRGDQTLSLTPSRDLPILIRFLTLFFLPPRYNRFCRDVTVNLSVFGSSQTHSYGYVV